MNEAVSSKSTILGEMSAVVTKADGTVVDLGVITSPFNSKFLNWAWKKKKSYQIKRLLNG